MTLFTLARSLPPSGYTPGRSAERAYTLIGVACLALIVGWDIATKPHVMKVYTKSKTDIASLTVKKYADEAYVEFRAAHPSRACPANLAELNEWMNSKDDRDPWGTEYVMDCSANGIVVRSAGEDRKFGTGDDLGSNE